MVNAGFLLVVIMWCILSNKIEVPIKGGSRLTLFVGNGIVRVKQSCSRVSVELSLVTPHCIFWRKWKVIVTTFYTKLCNNFWSRNVTRLAQNGTKWNFVKKCCNFVLRWKPSRETSLLLLQLSEKAKLIKLLNNNFPWKDNKAVELDNYLLTRTSGEAWNWSSLLW